MEYQSAEPREEHYHPVESGKGGGKGRARSHTVAEQRQPPKGEGSKEEKRELFKSVVRVVSMKVKQRTRVSVSFSFSVYVGVCACVCVTETSVRIRSPCHVGKETKHMGCLQGERERVRPLHGRPMCLSVRTPCMARGKQVQRRTEETAALSGILLNSIEAMEERRDTKPFSAHNSV